jgi:hypothetical protein
MRPLAKVVVGTAVTFIGGWAFVVVQERNARSTIESIRTSVEVGDTKEKVERVMREHRMRPEVGLDGRSYTARISVPFHDDISVTVILNGHWQVGMILSEPRS